MKKLTEIDAYLLDKIEVRERLAKKMKRFNTIQFKQFAGGISIAPFARVVGLPVVIALHGTTLLFSSLRKSFKIFIFNQEKHDATQLLAAQSKLDSIANIISQAMQDREIPSIEFHKVLQEVEKHGELKADIKNQGNADYKRTARRITLAKKKRRQRRFFTKNRKYFRYPGCQWHLKHKAPPPYIM